MTKSRNGSRRPDCAATNDIVVLSPPGMMRASQRANSSSLRTSMASKVMSEVVALPAARMVLAALRTRLRCSAKPPWRARTPTVRLIMFGRGWCEFLWSFVSLVSLMKGREGILVQDVLDATLQGEARYVEFAYVSSAGLGRKWIVNSASSRVQSF